MVRFLTFPSVRRVVTLRVFQGGNIHVHSIVHFHVHSLRPPTPVLRRELPQWYHAPSDPVERARYGNPRWTRGWAARQDSYDMALNRIGELHETFSNRPSARGNLRDGASRVSSP
jgi:hypothetical protein